MIVDELTNKIVKVSKDHQCIWCGGDIFAGDQAVARSYRVSTYNPRWPRSGIRSNYMHEDCNEVMNAAAWGIYDDRFVPYSFDRGTADKSIIDMTFCRRNPLVAIEIWRNDSTIKGQNVKSIRESMTGFEIDMETGKYTGRYKEGSR